LLRENGILPLVVSMPIITNQYQEKIGSWKEDYRDKKEVNSSVVPKIIISFRSSICAFVSEFIPRIDLKSRT